MREGVLIQLLNRKLPLPREKLEKKCVVYSRTEGWGKGVLVQLLNRKPPLPREKLEKNMLFIRGERETFLFWLSKQGFRMLYF